MGREIKSPAMGGWATFGVSVFQAELRREKVKSGKEREECACCNVLVLPSANLLE